ncbi:MAG TPA: SDR family oxidoreductase [Stellaceae bacterium]|nr:SDR family oxidoreductase [Stellaceae bacterium]
MKRLEGKIAVVTGGANGIGLGCARRFAEEGADVALIDLEGDALAAAAETLAPYETRVLTQAADCTDRAAITGFIERVERELGSVDILVNNVGQGARERKSTFLDSDESVWRFIVELNLFTTMRFSQLVGRGMVDRGGGRIINIASESAVIAPVMSHDYAAAKAAIIGFTRAIAREFAPRNVTVNAICPGPIRTRGIERSAGDEAKKALASILLPFVGETHDIGAVAAMLASEDGRYITGQSILVNGGRWFL